MASSSHLNWLIIRNNNAFLLKKRDIKKPFSTVSNPKWELELDIRSICRLVTVLCQWCYFEFTMIFDIPRDSKPSQTWAYVPTDWSNISYWKQSIIQSQTNFKFPLLFFLGTQQLDQCQFLSLQWHRAQEDPRCCSCCRQEGLHRCNEEGQKCPTPSQEHRQSQHEGWSKKVIEEVEKSLDRQQIPQGLDSSTFHTC